MCAPGAAEAFLRFENDKVGARTLLCEVIGTADTRNSGADNKDIEVLGVLWTSSGARCGLDYGIHVCVIRRRLLAACLNYAYVFSVPESRYCTSFRLECLLDVKQLLRHRIEVPPHSLSIRADAGKQPKRFGSLKHGHAATIERTAAQCSCNAQQFSF